jgi:hypothetical protein
MSVKVMSAAYMFKRRAKKRKVMVENMTSSVDLEEGWLDKLLELPGDELANLLGDIANHGKIKTAAIRKARIGLPSFSGAKWSDFTEQFGFPDELENNQFEQVVTPVYTLDVYQERQEHRREAGRVRIMDPVRQQLVKLLRATILVYAQYLVRIIGLFLGRIIDKPEQEMLETESATGGEVEHEVRTSLHPDLLTTLSTVLDLHDWRNPFFIAEIKLDMFLEDNAAQLFVKILGAFILLLGGS